MPLPNTDNFTEYEEAFNLLCGALIGRGEARTVYQCNLLPDCVVKVESGQRAFQNLLEFKFWEYAMGQKDASMWLAPVEFMSPDGRILIMKKTTAISKDQLPKEVPSYLCDLKIDNFGMYYDVKKRQSRIVCHDYGLNLAMYNTVRSKDKKKAIWS